MKYYDSIVFDCTLITQCYPFPDDSIDDVYSVVDGVNYYFYWIDQNKILQYLYFDWTFNIPRYQSFNDVLRIQPLGRKAIYLELFQDNKHTINILYFGGNFSELIVLDNACVYWIFLQYKNLNEYSYVEFLQNQIIVYYQKDIKYTYTLEGDGITQPSQQISLIDNQILVKIYIPISKSIRQFQIDSTGQIIQDIRLPNMYSDNEINKLSAGVFGNVWFQQLNNTLLITANQTYFASTLYSPHSVLIKNLGLTLLVFNKQYFQVFILIQSILDPSTKSRVLANLYSHSNIISSLDINNQTNKSNLIQSSLNNFNSQLKHSINKTNSLINSFNQNGTDETDSIPSYNINHNTNNLLNYLQNNQNYFKRNQLENYHTQEKQMNYRENEMSGDQNSQNNNDNNENYNQNSKNDNQNSKNDSQQSSKIYNIKNSYNENKQRQSDKNQIESVQNKIIYRKKNKNERKDNGDDKQLDPQNDIQDNIGDINRNNNNIEDIENNNIWDSQIGKNNRQNDMQIELVEGQQQKNGVQIMEQGMSLYFDEESPCVIKNEKGEDITVNSLQVNVNSIFFSQLSEQDQIYNLYFQAKINNQWYVFKSSQRQPIISTSSGYNCFVMIVISLSTYFCSRGVLHLLTAFNHRKEILYIQDFITKKTQTSISEKLFKKCYTIISENKLGEGAFGIVYQCKYTPTNDYSFIKNFAINQLFACKVLINTPDNMPSILQEIDALESVKECKSAIKMINYCITPEKVYIVLELAEQSLEDYLQKRYEQPFNSDEVISIALDLIEVLVQLTNKNFQHRDIKPSNILIMLDKQIKLTDFGAAKKNNLQNYTQKNNELIGSLPWMAPELLKAIEQEEYLDEYSLSNIDYEKCDIFSLGLTLLYVVLRTKLKGCNRLETQLDHFYQILDTEYTYIHLEFRIMLKKMTQFDPSKRPSCFILKQHILEIQRKSKSKSFNSLEINNIMKGKNYKDIIINS